MRLTKSFPFAKLIIPGATAKVNITDCRSGVAKKWHRVMSINPRQSYDCDFGTAYALEQDRDCQGEKDSSG
jgi:hypothetical protein